MESIPQGGAYDADIAMKSPSDLSSGTYFEANDVLVAKITPSFENGKQAWIRSLPLGFGYATTEVYPLRPANGKHDPRLLFYYLLHPDVRHYVAERMEGSTGRQRVPESVLLQLPIPEMDFTEQIRIASVLELVQRSMAKESESAKTAAELKQAAMLELFTRGLRGEPQKQTEIGPVPMNWEVVKLGHSCDLSTGTTPATKNKSYYEGTNPFVRTGDIVNNRISSSDSCISDQALRDYGLKLFPAGTLLMAMYGQGKTRGQVSLLEISAATTQNAAAIQCSDKLNPAFLWHYLMNSYDRLRGMGSLGHVSHLNLGYLRELLIPLPPLAEQTEITTILDAIDRKMALHREKRAVLEELFKSLLHQLMTGALRVDQLDLTALENTQPTSTQV
jgi:type I restriction enzyme S subunit